MDVVPPTGAKGLNLAMSDIYYLIDALRAFFADHDEEALTHYSHRALARVWKTERGSAGISPISHIDSQTILLSKKMKEAELSYVTSSEAGRQMIAENYVGLPL